MAVATFDTLKFANTLKAAGVPPGQAEAQAGAFAEVIQVNLRDLATKDDIQQLAKATKDDLARAVEDLRKDIKHEAKEQGQSLTAKIDGVELRLTAKIDTQGAQLRGEMAVMRWMLGAVFAFLIALLGLLLRLTFYHNP